MSKFQGGKSYLAHVNVILYHHDHLGNGTDCRVKVACIKDVWVGPNWFNWIIRDNCLKWMWAYIGRDPEIR